MTQKQIAENDHICPWWLAFTFDNPARKLIHPSKKRIGENVER